MSPAPRNSSVTQHLELTSAIDSWLHQIRASDDDFIAQVSVDLADILRAAEDVRAELDKLLTGKLTDAQSADEALQGAANIEVQLFTELKHHLESLEPLWPTVMDALERLSGTDS